MGFRLQLICCYAWGKWVAHQDVAVCSYVRCTQYIFDKGLTVSVAANPSYGAVEVLWCYVLRVMLQQLPACQGKNHVTRKISWSKQKSVLQNRV